MSHHLYRNPISLCEHSISPDLIPKLKLKKIKINCQSIIFSPNESSSVHKLMG